MNVWDKRWKRLCLLNIKFKINMSSWINSLGRLVMEISNCKKNITNKCSVIKN